MPYTPAPSRSSGAALDCSTRPAGERPQLLLPQPNQGGLHQRLLRRQLGAARQPDRDQGIDGPLRRDGGDLQVRRLQRDHDGGRVEAQDARQGGAAGRPVLAEGRGLLLQVGEERVDALDLDRRRQPPTQGADAAGEVAGAGDGVQGARQGAARLLHVEVGRGDREQGVVLRGLHLEGPRPQELPLRQGGVDRGRTLMAQVELPNPKGKFVPGMYAYGSVLIERPDVRALPASAVTQVGNQT